MAALQVLSVGASANAEGGLPWNTSMRRPSSFARDTYLAATLIGAGLGVYVDAESAKADLVPIFGGAEFLGAACVGVLYGTGNWS